MRLIQIIILLFIPNFGHNPSVLPNTVVVSKSEIKLDSIQTVAIKKWNIRYICMNELKHSKLSLENVKKYVRIMEIKHPEIVVKQFILETGWGKSYVCRKHHNLFGFRTKKGYEKYNHWTESIEAYKSFQDRKYKGGNYFNFLKKVGYAEASNYIQVLKTIKT